MSGVPETARAAARAVAEVVGGERKVNAYYDEGEDHRVDIATFAGRPLPRYTTYSTLALHLAPNHFDEKDVRVEFAGVGPDRAKGLANVLATAAFCVIEDGWLAAPGVVFPSLVDEYGLSSTLTDVVWMPPSPWQELGSVDLGDGVTAHWLLAVPISPAEGELLGEIGFDDFERRFEDSGGAYFDLERKPIA